MDEIVSVIIPSFGGGKYLNRAVDSVLNQTYKHIEVIVVDDNGRGTDNQIKTEKYMQKYEGDPRVIYICHEENRNGAAARNTGVKHASGSYISLLDDDDIFYENNIETQIAVLSKLPSDYALTYCSHDTYKGEKKISEKHVKKSGMVMYEVFMHSVTIGSSSILIRRAVWDELNGFDESFFRHQDWEFTARVASKYKVYAIDNIGFRRYLEYRNSPQSPKIAIQYRKHYLEKMQPYICLLPKYQARKIIVYNRLSAAVNYLKNKQIKEFIKEYFDIRPGIYLFVYIGYYIKNKSNF